MQPPDEVLPGGLGNQGRVVRIGDAVHRPARPATISVHLLLAHLERAGFAGAPRVLALEGDIEVLSFIPGDVAVPPFPAWSASDELLVSVAELQRDLHRAVADFEPPADAVWGNGQPPREFSGSLVCHNDICLENVVVVGGRARALIDFDFAGPADRVWDIAIALRHWVPMRDPRDVDEARAPVDRVARCRLFLAAHGLAAAERTRTIAAMLAFLDHALDFVRAQARAGHRGHAAQWNAGYEGMNRRAHRWVARHRAELTAG